MIVYSRSNEYTLSIRVSADGFCFAAHHPDSSSEYAFQTYLPDLQLPLPANLKKAKETLPLLQHDYGRVQLLLADGSYTTVPTEYVSEASARDYFVESFPLTTARQEVLMTAVSPQVAMLFSADKTLLKWIDTLFPGVEVAHAMLPVLRFALHGGSDRVLCYLHGRRMDVVCVRNGQLQFVNTFDNDTADNALYYLLGVWQTLGLSQTDDVLTLAGRATDSRELTTALSRFIRRIGWVDAAAEFHATELARHADLPFDLQALTGLENA